MNQFKSKVPMNVFQYCRPSTNQRNTDGTNCTRKRKENCTDLSQNMQRLKIPEFELIIESHHPKAGSAIFIEEG